MARLREKAKPGIERDKALANISRSHYVVISRGGGKLVGWLVGWSLTSLFSTNTAISESKASL